jgi:AcrR family transcriptional regulator
MTWRRKSETDEALHESIMEATARAIVKHGVSNLTVRDIGAEFDRSRSLINYHYNSKQELLETFVEYTADQYSRGLTQDPDGRPDIQLDRFVRNRNGGGRRRVLARGQVRRKTIASIPTGRCVLNLSGNVLPMAMSTINGRRLDDFRPFRNLSYRRLKLRYLILRSGGRRLRGRRTPRSSRR